MSLSYRRLQDNSSKRNSLDIFIDKSEKKFKARQDMILIILISLITLFFSAYFDFYEFLFHWTRQYDWFEIDELIITTLVFFPGLVWFSHRRWKDARYALNKSLKVQASLESSQRQQADTLNENRRLLNRISEIQEAERKRIASDLHDIFGQYLTAIHANASTIKTGLQNDPALIKIVDKVISNSEQLSRLTRLMLNELRPTILEKIGLDAALSNLVAEWQENNPAYQIEFSSNGDDRRINISVALVIYRSVQEGLTNILKHSGATEVSLFVDYQSIGDDESNNWIFMLLSDNGCGFVYPPETEGLGLIGIRERVNNLEGSFEIVTAQQEGTELSILIPRDIVYQ